MIKCMVSGDVIKPPSAISLYPEDTIIVTQNGKAIGFVSKEAQNGVKTLQMVLHRDKPDVEFVQQQGQCLKTF